MVGKMIRFRSIPADLTYDLRHKVLWPDSPIERVMVSGDEEALHIGAYEGEALIGVGSFFFDLPFVRLRKLAVLPEKQGRGIGSNLIRFAASQPEVQKLISCGAMQGKTRLCFTSVLASKLKEIPLRKQVFPM